MTSINPIYKINDVQMSNFKIKGNTREDTFKMDYVPNQEAFKGTEALRAYNYNIVNSHSPEYLKGCETILAERDLNKDGNTSVEEALCNDNFKITNPDFHERDKKSLKKYALQDSNPNVTAKEYADWLNGPEHQEVLDEFTLLKAEEIKKKRQNTL